MSPEARHHRAAAAGVPAVVLFGSFILPDHGYQDQINLTGARARAQYTLLRSLQAGNGKHQR